MIFADFDAELDLIVETAARMASVDGDGEIVVARQVREAIAEPLLREAVAASTPVE